MWCSSFGAADAPRVQGQSWLAVVLERADLTDHRGMDAVTCRVVGGGKARDRAGEDLGGVGPVVLGASGLEEAVHIGLGDIAHPRVAKYAPDRVGRGAAEQPG